jgi:hypothetical protein
MSLTLLDRLMIDCAGAAEHYVEMLNRTEFASTETHAALANLRKAVLEVKKQREFLKAHSEWPEKRS